MKTLYFQEFYSCTKEWIDIGSTTLPSADRSPFDLRFFSLWGLLRNLNAEKSSRVPVYTFNALKDRYVQPQIAVIPISTVRTLQNIPYPYRSKIPSNINTPNTKITL